MLFVHGLYCPLRPLLSLPPPSLSLISGGRPTWSHPVCRYYCLPLYPSVHDVHYWNCIWHSHYLSLWLVLFPVWQVIVGWHAMGVWSIICPCQPRWMPPPHTLLHWTVTQVLLSTVNFVMGDCEELKIVTFNTNGLREFKKRKDIFNFLRKQRVKVQIFSCYN